MICTLCGETPFPVTMREFVYAGQKAVLSVCDTCADRANTALARRESLTSLRSPLDVDVKAFEPEPGQEMKDRAAARARLAARGGVRLHFGRERKRVS